MRRLALTAAVIGVALVVWRLADVLLLAFGAVLVAALLHALAGPLVTRVRLPRPLALTLAVIALGGAIAASLWLFGQQMAVQLAALGELLPRAWTGLQQRLSGTALGGYVLADLERLRHADGLLTAIGPRLIRGTAGAAATSVIVIFAGLYMALHPSTYLGGLLKLFPPSGRARAAEVLEACNVALHRWLVGQLVSMVLVGVTTGVGLWLVGVPSPLALGVIAGLGQFVPVIGPMAATIPGLILAAGAGSGVLAWTAVVYVGAIQFEANVITPLVLRQMVELPMAVTLFAVLAMGVLLGPLGVVFATPLAVVAYVALRMVYLEDLLGEPPARR
jgi:predicted PurR-regulated permease PerM